MCINMVFPKGYSKTSDEVKNAIISGLEANSLSSGYAYKKNGADHIVLSKGFIRSYPAEIAQEIIDLNLDEKDELIVHGRIATCGDRGETQAHPFVLSSDIKETLMVKGTTKKPVLIHNGIFGGLGAIGNTGNSDTAEFCNTIGASKFFIESSKRNPDKTIETLKKADADLWGWSKLAILYPDHDLVVMGTYIEESFGFFSNTGYKDNRVRNRGGVEKSSSFMTPQTDSAQLLLELASSTSEGLTDRKCNLYGKGVKEFVFFRQSHREFSICFSNTKLIPNNFNILFLNGIRNKVEAYCENTIIKRISDGEKINLLSVSNLNTDLVFRKSKSLTSSYEMISYHDSLRFFDYAGIGTLEKSLVETEKHALLTLKRDYEDLCQRSSLEINNGCISKSYAKKLYEVLWKNIGKIYFDRNFNMLKHHTKDCITFTGFSTLTIDKVKLNSNKNLIFDVNILALFLFYIERSKNLDAINLQFDTTVINEILTSTAIRLGIQKKWYYPPISYGSTTDEERRKLMDLTKSNLVN